MSYEGPGGIAAARRRVTPCTRVFPPEIALHAAVRGEARALQGLARSIGIPMSLRLLFGSNSS